MIATDKAIRLARILGEACDLLTDLDIGTTDAESSVLYGWLQAVAGVKAGLTDGGALDRIYDRQAVIDATI